MTNTKTFIGQPTLSWAKQEIVAEVEDYIDAVIEDEIVFTVDDFTDEEAQDFADRWQRLIEDNWGKRGDPADDIYEVIKGWYDSLASTKKRG